MGRTKLQTVYRCDLCDYSSKNTYLYRRHKTMCRRNHGMKKYNGKYVPMLTVAKHGTDTGTANETKETVEVESSLAVPSPENKEPAPENEQPVPNEESALSLEVSMTTDPDDSMTTDPDEYVESSPNTDPNKEVDLNKQEKSMLNSDSDKSQISKAPTTINRNYKCKNCNFKTVMSRQFLYHMVQAHKATFDIFPCTICEYCSPYRNKLQRHLKIAHKATVAIGDIRAEYECGGIKHRASPKKKQRRTVITRNIPGKKLTVKFMKTSTKEVSSSTAFKASSQLQRPVVQSSSAVSQSAANSTAAQDHLSRIVDEITSEEGGTIFKCKECQFIADDKQKVAKHAVSWHVDTKSFLCSYCDYITFERNDFLAHRLTHRNDHRYKCDECTYSTDFRPNYDRHMNNHRQSFPYKCSFCSYGCGSEAGTRRHMASNHDPVPPPIKKMKLPVPKSKNNTTEPNKEIDETITTSLEPESTVPDKVVKAPRKKSKSSISSKHKPSIFEGALPTMVPMNSSVLNFPESYEKSLSRESSPNRKLPPNITKFVQKDNGKLICPACRLQYKRASDLNRHMKRKHGCKLREYLETYTTTPISESGMETDEIDTSQESVDLSGTNSDFNQSEDYIESNDGVEFINENSFGDDDGFPLDLSNTSNEHTSPVSAEKLKCKHCDFQAKWPSDLRRHSPVHSLEKRYQCNFCSRKYKYTGDLNVHIRKDHKKEPGNLKVLKVATMAKKKSSPAIFKCPCCTYTSCWKSEVDRHSRLHNGEKTFQCRHCDYQSFWRGDIRRHMYKRHPSVMTDGVAINDVINIRKDLASQAEPVQNSEEGNASVITGEEQMDTENGLADVNSSSKNSSFISTLDDTGENPSDGNILRAHSHSPSPIKEMSSGCYKCQYCGFVANAPSKISSHIATHTNLKRYKCPICGRRANWKWDIAKHIKKDHNDHDLQVVKLSKKEAEESIKDYIEGNPVIRREHHLNVTPDKARSTVNKLLKCSACDFTAENPVSVTRHIRFMHSAAEVHIVVIEKQKTPPQPQLTPQKSQSSPNPSAEHTPPQLTPQKLYTSVPNNTNPMSKLVDTDGPLDAARPFMCSECGKRGATKGDVKKHYHYVHSDKEIRIVYLGGGSQSVYASKDDLNAATDSASGSNTAVKIASVEPLQGEAPVLVTPMEVTAATTLNEAITLNETTAQQTQNSDGDGKKTGAITNPKAIGYIRPFKCSICEWRSNWRWALCKHIRDKHIGENAEIIILSEAEARATVPKYIEQNIGETGKSNSNNPTPPHTKRKYIQRKNAFGTLKCSACAYRANQKADVQRHIYRRHGAIRAKVVTVEKDSLEKTNENYTIDTQKLDDGKSNNQNKPAEKKFIQPSLNLSQSPTSPVLKKVSEKKAWKCSMCPYTREDKLDVLRHIGKHNLKTYRCTACNYSSNFRSGVYRHIKSKHDGEMAFCRLSIRMIKEGAGDMETPSPQVEKSPAVAVHDGNPIAINTTAAAAVKDIRSEQDKVTSVQFCCKICSFKSRHRSCVCRHILGKHNTKEYINLIVKRVVGHSSLMPKSPQEVVVHPKTKLKSGKPSHTASPVKTERVLKRNFVCTICPYRTYKSKMLEFHMTCHKPQPGVKQVKCKHCPYYVSGARLLVQHNHLHTQDINISPYPHTPVKKHTYVARPPRNTNVPKRHKCEKCPYATNSKNDFLYHKQFHRPKPTADFRCEYCEYWVTHKRLLKQHMKVHEDAGQTGPTAVAPSPAKSDFSVMSSENAFVYDVVEMAALKQRIISSKITPSISQTPIVSPMKLASNCSIGNKRGFLRKDGTYRKIHKCPKCPYMNIRIRNMRLHELMHGKRSSTATLMKCLHCDYYVGSKGLLAHHMKVHQPDYGLEFTNSNGEVETIHSEDLASEDSEMEQNITTEKQVDTLLEIARFKKYGCEKCPYASAKRVHFQRHMELHGSKQKCKCNFCDYSVPTQVLLDQHVKLHFEPNQNLLAAQSLLNLQHLPEMPADVALASMMINNDSKHPVSVTHDHVDLYENAPEDNEPKKIYRCDRCPYANIRRDHLLAHLRCHMIKNEHRCPYCDYSVGKIHVLVQHVKVHFNPLPELSEWLSDNGEMERMKESKPKDMKEAIEVVHLYRKDLRGANSNGSGTSSKACEASDGENEPLPKANCSNTVTENEASEEKQQTKENLEQSDADNNTKSTKLVDIGEDIGKGKEESIEKGQNESEKHQADRGSKTDGEVESNPRSEGGEMKIDVKKVPGADDSTEAPASNDEMTATTDPTNFNSGNTHTDKKSEGGVNPDEATRYICQYCDRDFVESDHLVRHEMQHLIGNKYEDFMEQLKVLVPVSKGPVVSGNGTEAIYNGTEAMGNGTEAIGNGTEVVVDNGTDTANGKDSTFSEDVELPPVNGKSASDGDGVEPEMMEVV